MAELWRMSQGRLRVQRELSLSLAALVWSLGKMTSADVSRYIQRGELVMSGSDQELYDERIHGRLERGR